MKTSLVLALTLVYLATYAQDSTKVSSGNFPEILSITGFLGNSYNMQSKDSESDFPQTQVNQMKGFKLSGMIPLFVHDNIRMVLRTDYLRVYHTVNNEFLGDENKELQSGYLFLNPQIIYITKLGKQPFNLNLSVGNYGIKSDNFYKLSYLAMAIRSFDWNGHKFRAGIGYIYIENQINVPFPLIISNKTYHNDISLNLMFPFISSLQKKINTKNNIILGLKLDPFNLLLAPDNLKFLNNTLEYKSLGLVPEIKYEYNVTKSFWIASILSYRMNIKSEFLDDNHNVITEINQESNWIFSVKLFIRPSKLKR